MKRHSIEARPQWHDRLAWCGLGFSTAANQVDWNETACYEVSQREANTIHEITNQLYQLMIDATDRLVERQELAEFGIPLSLSQPLTNSWEHADYLPTLFTRFDFEWLNDCPRLVNIACGAPSQLIESAVAQWDWAQQRVPWALQFNTIEERLSLIWKDYRYQGRMIHLGYNAGEIDQFLTAEYLQRLANDAGVEVTILPYSEIRLADDQQSFNDASGNPLHLLINLGAPTKIGGVEISRAHAYESLTIAEPLWKDIWKSEKWLRHLGEFHPHPAIYIDDQPHNSSERRLYCSSWVVGGEACGIGMMERSFDGRSVTTEFIPHLLAS